MIAELERLPDISFIDDITLDDIEADLVARYQDKYREITGNTATLKPGEPIQLMLYACATIFMQMYESLDFAGKMNFLKYAYGDYLDNLGALKSVERLDASAALCTVRFTASVIRAAAISIPAGTRVTSQKADIYFATSDYAEIPAGEEYVDVTCQALTPGIAGNDYAIGTLSVIVDPIAYVASCTNLTAASGGTDRESDDSLRERIYLSPANYSVAGPEKAYEYFVKTAYPGIADVRVTSPAPTEINIRVIGPDGQLLSSDVLQMIEDYLETEGVRPQTDLVSVESPTVSEYAITMTYYINKSDAPVASTIQAAVEGAVSRYAAWQSARIGRDIEPGKLIEFVMDAGAKRVAITSPSYTTIADTAIAKLTSMTVTYGGLEND